MFKTKFFTIAVKRNIGNTVLVIEDPQRPEISQGLAPVFRPFKICLKFSAIVLWPSKWVVTWNFCQLAFSVALRISACVTVCDARKMDVFQLSSHAAGSLRILAMARPTSAIFVLLNGTSPLS